jgi:hypothetical protein
MFAHRQDGHANRGRCRVASSTHAKDGFIMAPDGTFVDE